MPENNFEFIWKRQYSIPQGLPAVPGLFNFAEQFLGEKIVARGEWDRGWLSVYSREGLMADVGKKIAGQVEENDEEVERWISMVHERGEKLVSFASNIPYPNDLSLKDMFIVIHEYFQLFGNYMLPLWHSFYAAEAAGSAVLKMLRANGVKDEAVLMSILSQPSKKAHVMKITDHFKSERDVDERVKYLNDNFPWIGSADPLTEPYTDKQLHDYAKAFANENTKEKKNTKEEKQIDIKGFDNRIIKIYQDTLFVKDKRDEYRRILFHHMYPLYLEISQRLSISLEDLALVFPDELERLENDLNGLRKDIKERKKGLLVEKDASGFRKWEGEEAQQRMHRDDKNNGEIREIKGISGSSGKVIGLVQVVSLSNLSEFKEGNILVVVTTNPNFVPAMQKAKAFVTDEGGVTCHAAIVARELGKPCVVGTKIATKVLKDGDLVEVDAEKGVVKILNK